MARTTILTIAFADGEYEFGLGLAQIEEIQNRCNAGIGAVFARISRGRFFRKSEAGDVAFGNHDDGEYALADITAVITQGLIGGGKGIVDGVDVKVDATRATQLVRNYVTADNCPLEEGWTLAHAILAARIVGFEPPNGAALDQKKKRDDDGRIDFGQALVNCAMMGIGPEECGRMDLWTYGALLWNWNRAHDPDAQNAPRPVDPKRLARFTDAHRD